MSQHTHTHIRTHTVYMSLHTMDYFDWQSVDLERVHAAFVTCNCCCITSVTFHLEILQNLKVLSTQPEIIFNEIITQKYQTLESVHQHDREQICTHITCSFVFKRPFIAVIKFMMQMIEQFKAFFFIKLIWLFTPSSPNWKVWRYRMSFKIYMKLWVNRI